MAMEQSTALPRTSSPELTFRAVFSGLLIGCLLCFTNLYFGLQTGWISMMSLQSALLGYLLSLIFFKSPMSPQENVVLQTTAVATGTMPLAAGFVGIIPALSLLNRERDGVDPIRVGWIAGVGWSCAVAFFGVVLASPLRKQVIIKEKLVFPSGTATAQLISVLHRIPPPTTASVAVRSSTLTQRRRYYEPLSADDVIPNQSENGTTSPELRPGLEHERNELVQTGWRSLGWSFAASGTMTLAAYFFPFLNAIPLFGTHLAQNWLWVFSPSLSYVGQGIIMGLPTTVSMNLGMIVGWGILSPIAKHSGWAPGPVSSTTDGARGWILWVALAVMMAESFVSLVPVAADLFRSLRRRPKSPSLSTLGQQEFHDEDEDPETPDRLVPLKWITWGAGASISVGTILVWIVFGHEGIKPWATVIGFLLGALLSLLGVRALGETDLNPVSGVGKISQLFFALIQPRNVVANIIAGGVAEAGAQQAGDLMQDIKTGHLLGASPRAQFQGQLVGSAFSIFVTATAYSLYTRAYPIPGPSFPAPTAYVWLSLARLLRDGSLPTKCGKFMLLGGALTAIVAILKIRAVSHGVWYAKWVPSGIAFAIGFLNTPSFSIARLIGGLIEYVYNQRRRDKDDQGIRLIIVASGFVLGEGVVSIVGLLLRTLGIGAASCWGCLPHICSCT